jgi:hypothetical protein
VKPYEEVLAPAVWRYTPALHMGVFQATSNVKDIDSAINSADITVLTLALPSYFLDIAYHSMSIYSCVSVLKNILLP